MKRIVINVVMFALLVTFGMTVSGQVVVGQSYVSIDTSAPIVPLEVATKGRQAVVSSLFRQVDYVTVEVVGKSVMTPSGWSKYYISHEELKKLGYTDAGSFDQLSKAINGYQFECKVLPYTYNGQSYFDVRLIIEVFTKDGKKAFIGNGYVPISYGKGGGVVVDKTQSWVYLNDSFTIDVGTRINGAMWIGDANSTIQNQNLSTQYVDNDTTYIAMNSWYLGNGHLSVALNDGNVVVISLVDGLREVAEVAVGIMSSLASSDIQVLNNPSDSSNWGDVAKFYTMSGQYYGRFPLLEIVTDKNIKNIVSLSVPVWGSDNRVQPSKIFVTPIKMYGSDTGYKIGEETEIAPVRPAVWGISLPAGIFHIRAIFPDVTDNDNGMGKG